MATLDRTLRSRRRDIGWCIAVIYSGLDWSGSPGRHGDPQMVFAVAHAHGDDLPHIEGAFAALRKELNVDRGFPFKHVKTSRRTQELFFAMVGGLPIMAHAYVMDATSWGPIYTSRTDGDGQISDGIIHVILGCPNEVVAQQTLYLDIPSDEAGRVVDFRTALRQALKGSRRAGFKNVPPCPDHREHGTIVQLADMIAGEINEHSGIAGPFLPALRSRICTV